MATRLGYNGYSPEERTIEGKWETWARKHGILDPIGSTCEGCGSTENLQAHLEDYAEPEAFWTVCVLCHLTLHTRFKSARHLKVFVNYRNALAEWEPNRTDFGGWSSMRRMLDPRPAMQPRGERFESRLLALPLEEPNLNTGGLPDYMFRRSRTTPMFAA